MAKNNIKIDFDASSIMNVSLSSSKSGYNYASVSVKISDDNYMSVGYEWKDRDDAAVPDFVMDLLAFIKKDKANVELASEYKEFAARYKGQIEGEE